MKIERPESVNEALYYRNLSNSDLSEIEDYIINLEHRVEILSKHLSKFVDLTIDEITGGE
jgi:hypothetical protein